MPGARGARSLSWCVAARSPSPGLRQPPPAARLPSAILTCLAASAATRIRGKLRLTAEGTHAAENGLLGPPERDTWCGEDSHLCVFSVTPDGSRFMYLESVHVEQLPQSSSLTAASTIPHALVTHCREWGSHCFWPLTVNAETAHSMCLAQRSRRRDGARGWWRLGTRMPTHPEAFSVPPTALLIITPQKGTSSLLRGRRLTQALSRGSGLVFGLLP